MTRDWKRDKVNTVLKRCRVCGEYFIGYKRREICYACVHEDG